ncbi:MAG: hypothetical protein QME81_12680 [bacterium]|nr:hypothetical protein [bacterium]
MKKAMVIVSVNRAPKKPGFFKKPGFWSVTMAETMTKAVEKLGPKLNAFINSTKV